MSTTGLDAVLASTFRFAWLDGAETPIGDHTTGWRRLPGFMMAQVINARTRVQIEGRPDRYATHGMAVIIDGGVHHRLSSVVRPKAFSRWMHGTFHVLDGVSVLSLFELPAVVPPAIGQVIGDACAELAARHRDAPLPLADLRVTGIGLRVLDTLLGSAPMTSAGQRLAANADRLTPVLAWIEHHLAEPVSRAGLARLAGLSPSRFHDLFLDVLGSPPMAYLAQRRMRRAQELLMAGGLPVAAIAAAVGYADPFHFSRAFRALVGRSPRAYRAEIATLSPTRSSTVSAEHT